MNKSLVIGDSGGIGAALRKALGAGDAAAQVDGLSRTGDGLDIRDEASVSAAMATLAGPYDTILIATGALVVDGIAPEKALRDVTKDSLISQFETNTIGPALVLKHALRLVPRDRRCVVAALSARVGSIGDNRLGGWYGYRASKAALNQVVHTAAIEMRRARRHAICVVLHPGTVATDFTKDYQTRHSTVSADAAAQNILTVLERLCPGDTGRFFDWSGREIPW